ncbi:glycosyltransferase family 4 protein [Virgibacillus sp. DJP39]|uniref:glycosyltransferase family 4 protein n=1 Tax=Virgibacillus sp. DJP39 TaxID=3409790 RepID=UPI003BB5B413
MKIVLASPNFHQPRGNTVTVQRIANNLTEFGVEVEIISTTESAQKPFPVSDLVHGFHAYRFYTFMQRLGANFDPYVITLTGTDLNHDLFDKERRNDVLACLTNAKAIHVFDNKAKQTLINEIPKLQDKIFTIAQGSSIFPESNSTNKKEKDTFLFVLPAGIRKVKNLPAAIDMLRDLHEKVPQVRLWIVGPVLEEEEGCAIKELAEKHKDWLDYLGQLPHLEMGSIYEQADVVLNTSHAEGQPSTIIEAMSYGIPVLVSNILGNSSIVSHEKNGFLYSDRNEFLAYAETIMNNYYEIKQTIGQSAKQYIARNHSADEEAETLLKIYSNILH